MCKEHPGDAYYSIGRREGDFIATWNRSQWRSVESAGLNGRFSGRIGGREGNPGNAEYTFNRKDKPMLASRIAVGTTLVGLAELLDGGGIVGGDAAEIDRGIRGTYRMAGQGIIFFSDETGDERVNILPYVAGAISYATMQGRQTISGPFTGCTMAVYNNQGTTRVCHVDTAPPSTGEAPSKTRWNAMKDVPGFELADELVTKGMIDDFLDHATGNLARFSSLCILAVATPVQGITHYYAIRNNRDYVIVPSR
jgi:hypothetical protein